MQWHKITTTDDYPTKDGKYVCITESKNCCVLNYTSKNKCFYTDSDLFISVVLWMELPPIPNTKPIEQTIKWYSADILPKKPGYYHCTLTTGEERYHRRCYFRDKWDSSRVVYWTPDKIGVFNS